MISSIRARRALTTAALGLALTTLSACGSDDSDFNDADVTFATDMIPHHA